MKSLYIITLLFISTISQAQIVDIPDANFKNALLNYNPIIDTNNDGEIQVSEAEAVLSLDVSPPYDIESLEGIQSFINLEILDCSFNNFTNLDFSQNINLIELVCWGSNLINLNVTQNTNLTILKCGSNDITSLDVTQNTNLTFLECSGNSLNNLDVSLNTNLIELDCKFNNLNNLDVTQNLNLSYLKCDYNNLTAIDVTQNLYLEELRASGNSLNTIDVSHNLNLKALFLGYNNIIDLDITQNNNLTNLSCSSNTNFSNLYFSNNQALTYLNVANTSLSSIDFSLLPNLEFFKSVGADFTSIDLSQNHQLEIIRVGGNYNLTNLNIKNGNNGNIENMYAKATNLICIVVDDVNADFPDCLLSNSEGWCKDESVFYSEDEDCSLGIEDYKNNSFTLYPNPTKNTLFIESQDLIETVIIYNPQGQFIKKEETSTSRIDVSNLASGLYFVQVESNGVIIIKKFIKE